MWPRGTILALPGQTVPWGTVVYSGALGYLVQLVDPPPSPVHADTYWYAQDALGDYVAVGATPVRRVQVKRATEGPWGDWLDW
jgi:hypothetical protein